MPSASSRLNTETLTFTGADSSTGTVTYTATGNLECSAPVIAAAGLTATSIAISGSGGIVATSTFNDLTVGTLHGVATCELIGSTSGTLTLHAAAVTSSHTLNLPAAQGAASSYLRNNGSGTLTWASTGDASGPSSATDNAVARFDLTTGKLLQNSGVTVSDTADIAGAKTVALSGATSGVLTLQPAATTTNHTLTMPSAQGAASSYLGNDGSGGLTWSTPAAAAVTGFVSITTTSQTGALTDNFVLFTPPSSTSLAYTLPNPSTTSGLTIKYMISKSATALNSTVTLTAPSGKTVNGAATFILACVGDFVTLMSNSNDWVVTDKPYGRLLISHQTVSAASTVTFDSVFAASKYTSYSVEMSLLNSGLTAASTNTMRLRSGGASITGAYYSMFSRYIGSGAFNQGDATGNNNDSSWGATANLFNFAAAGDQVSISGEIVNPVSTTLFKRISLAGAFTSGGATFSEFASGQYRVAATTADGFIYTSTSGTVTGYAKIYANCE